MTLHLAVAQFRPVKADLGASLDRAEEIFAKIAAMDPSPDVVLFPESALTGYFLEDGVTELAVGREELFRRLQERYRSAADDGSPLQVGLGFYERSGSGVYNSALYAQLGDDDPGILHVHRKVFLPTYNVFQENRFVAAGDAFAAFDAGWGGAAFLVCEDAWHSVTATLAALDGAHVLLIPSASPGHGIAPGSGRPSSVDRWERVLRGMAEEHGVFVAHAGLVGFEGGKGMAGASRVYGPTGEELAAGPLWEEALLTAELDLTEIPRAREASPLITDLKESLPRILQASPASPGRRGPSRGARRPGTAGPGDAEASGADGDPGSADAGVLRGPPPLAVAVRPEAGEGSGPDPDDASPLEIDPSLVEEWLLQFLRQEVRIGRGFERLVVGLSGGVDSSLAALLAVRALGPENVRAYYLPSDVSSEESREDAASVADDLGIALRTIEVTGAVDAYLEEHEPDASERRRGNVMARQRMVVLFDQAAKHDALPLGTGNKSERLLGYFTWHADDAPPVNPLGDLFKTQVRQLARHVGLPDRVVEKTPSAELVPGQTDEGAIGVPYAVADLVLHHTLRGYTPAELVEAGFEEEHVRIVRQRLDGTHFKRHTPTVAMLTSTSVGDGYLRPVDYPGPGRIGRKPGKTSP